MNMSTVILKKVLNPTIFVFHVIYDITKIKDITPGTSSSERLHPRQSNALEDFTSNVSIFISNENVNTNTEKSSKSHDIRFSRYLRYNKK